MVAAAILKNPKSWYLRNGLADPHEIWRDDAQWPSEHYGQLKFSTGHISATNRPSDTNFGTMSHIDPLNLTGS